MLFRRPNKDNASSTPPARKKKPTKWTDRNFVTEVLIPSFFKKKAGESRKPTFPTLKEGELAVTWIGHASFLLQTGPSSSSGSAGFNIIIDPNWANWLVVIRRLRRAGFDIEDLPTIDLVLVTHAHFDHLNRRSLRRIAARQPIVVPHGVGNLVHDLGFERVHELRWWEDMTFRKFKITFTPAKHWGARTITDKHRGYGGFVIETPCGRRIYHCGDSAYFEGFKEIGTRLKPEIALMPIGAYEPPSGRDVHMGPEEALKAFQELGATHFIPMHFGTYPLSYEPMDEPAERLLMAGSKEGLLPNIKILTEGMPEVF
ncbi:MAG: MBL fold metallo-hydrolase [Candidatus Methylacidiphilales bacterium]|nr:MBL fold metallo-hydrolase [Candidatus Methylacidiphilales bacterium]